MRRIVEWTANHAAPVEQVAHLVRRFDRRE